MAKEKIVLAEIDIDMNALKKSIKETQEEIDKLEKKQQKLIDKGKETGSKFKENAQELSLLKASYTAQQAVITGVDTAMARSGKTFNDYKEQVKKAAQEINIFNGGLGGLISRAQEASGAGPLVSGAFKGMAEGIGGMTKSALAFIATPIGFVIAALAGIIALVQNAMNSSSESANKITKIFTTFTVITDSLMKVLAPLGDFLIDGIAAGFDMAGKAAEKAMGWIADGLSFLGFDESAESVRGFTEEVKNTAIATNSLKEVQKELAAQMSVQEVANEKAKQQMDELISKSENQALSEKERTEALEKAIAIETENYNQRKVLANQAYNTAIQQAMLGKKLTMEEISELQKGGAAYAEKMMKVKGFTQEEIDALKNAQLEKMRINGAETQMLQSQMAAREKMEADFAAQRDKREQQEAERKAKAKKAMDDAIQKMDLELQRFIQTEGSKAKTLEQSMKYEQDIRDRKLAIAEAEFKASEKNGNDKLKLDIARADILKDYAGKAADTTAAFAKAQYDKWLEQNQSQIVEGQKLTDTLVAEEAKRLDAVKAHQLELLKQQQGTNDEIIAQKRLNNQLLSDEDQAYLNGKDAIEKTHKDKNIALEKQFSDQKAADKAVENEIALAQADSKYEEDMIKEKVRYDAEVAKLKERKDQGLLTEQQYNALLEVETKKHADNNKAIEKAKTDNKIALAENTFANLATIMGKESAAGKAIAVAQATMDTYKAATAAYASLAGITIVGPALGAVAAAAVASGIANVKKITSTKAPKAEKGALFSIGGRRHSAGGTFFQGEDGTAFEAEQGELIGVMNRNAAKHFMAFNNAFPAGSGRASGNYFASGGIVSREIATPAMNTDELAAKIAEANRSIPAPVVSVQDIVTEGNSYVRVRDGANF